MYSWTNTKYVSKNPYNFMVGDVIQAIGGNAPGILGTVVEYTELYVMIQSIKDAILLEKYTGSKEPQIVFNKLKLIYKSNLDFFILEEMKREQSNNTNQSEEVNEDSDLTESYSNI